MAASSVIPRPPNQTPSAPQSTIPSAKRTNYTKSRKSSINSAALIGASHPSRPGSSASTTSSRIAGPRVSAGIASGARTPTSASARSVSSGFAIRSPTSISTAYATKPGGQLSSSSSTQPIRKKVSIASFPQPPGSAAAVQRATSYSGIAIDTSQSRPPISSGRSVTSAASTTAGSRAGHARGIPRVPSSANTSVKGVEFGDSNSAMPSPSISSPGFIESGSTSPTKMSSTDQDSGRSKEAKGNVLVSVRVRPDVGGASHDSSKSDVEWMVDGRRSLVAYRGREGGEYTYDNVFAAHDTNARVYDAAAKRLVRRVMEGYHGTVFAYGMTGTGKTFSMQGTASSPGVIPLAITDIFAFIRETPHREFLLRVSYLEIYNEKIFDLLSAIPGATSGTAQEEIKLREDARRGVYATPLKEEIVQSPTQLLRVIARGDNCRRTAGTQFNSRSSRSHAVVQIVVESRERAVGGPDKRSASIPGGVRVSTLSLIDLAGSERAAESKERRTEGAHINKSLLTLGTVISRLSTDKDIKDGGKHLPYRDSKLTRLLQPALSGNSLVSILCTLHLSSGASGAASQTQINETLNTLKFASRAKNNIVSHAKRSEEALPGDSSSRALLDRYRMEITDLRKQLEQQKELTRSSAQRSTARPTSGQLADDDDIIDPVRERERMRREDEENQRRHEEQMLEMQLARTALKERIEHLNRLILSSKSLGVNTSLPFDRSQSSLSFRNGSAFGMSSATGSVGVGLSRGVTSRLSGTSLDLSTARSPSTADSYYAAGSDFVSSGYPTPISEHPPRIRDPACQIATSPSSDSLGSNGDGTASLASQVRALQADLADRNRYIDTLERRLLHARRSSQTKAQSSSFGMPTLCPACRDGAANGVESVLRDKDDEIRDLKARLDDKDRMCNVLRSAARRGLAVDTLGSGLPSSSVTTPNVSSPPNIPLPPLTVKRDSVSSLASASGRRTSGVSTYRPSKAASRGVNGSTSSISKKVFFPSHSSTANDDSPGTTSPLRPVGRKSSVAFTDDRDSVSVNDGSVDEMTKLLDQMLTDRRRSHVTSTASLPVPLLSRTASSSPVNSPPSHSPLVSPTTGRPTSLPLLADGPAVKEDRIDSGIVMDD